MSNSNIPAPVSIEDVITLLNEALELDREAITALVGCRVKCNKALADHPTIQVGWFPIDGSLPEAGSSNKDDGKSELKFGTLGLLNGLFGFRQDDWGYISAVYDEPGGIITHFEKTDPKMFRTA